MSFLISLAAFFLAIGILVTVHEYGHFWVARRCGVKVLTFSIGFGKPLLTWQRGEVQWQIAAIPLGGFVRMLDEREGPVPAEERHRAFNQATVWRRIAIVAAGPVANFLLAILVYWGIFMAGVDVLTPRIGTVKAASIAAQAGFMPGDVITALDGDPVSNWQEVRMGLVEAGAARARLPVAVETASGNPVIRELDLSRLSNAEVDGSIAFHLGLTLERLYPVLGRVRPGSLAEQAGLRSGDELVAVESQPTPDWLSFSAAIQARPGLLTRVEVKRQGQLLAVTLTPETQRVGDMNLGRIGVEARADTEARNALFQFVQYGPLEALQESLSQTWKTSALSLKMMGRMLQGQVSVKQLSGPVTMASVAGQSAQVGFQAYLIYLCLISISLGVLNLLPIPVLDGGHLLYYLAELLRGRPLPDQVMEVGQRVGVSLLLLMMMVALFNDITRVVSG